MITKIDLWGNKETCRSYMTTFLLPTLTPRPAVLVIPGGGYSSVCEKTEGPPAALAFNRLGFHAFVLNYRVAPNRFPAPLEDAVRAVKIIRGHADEWKILPDRIVSCGFSAGGHLAGALGILQGPQHGCAGDQYDAVSGKVDAMILCYGVLVHAPWSHTCSWNSLTGGDKTLADHCSLERKITGETPPAFVWATMRDQAVDCRNSIVFAEAMLSAGRPCELHLYPYGDHGMLLGLDTLDVIGWPSEAKCFLETQWAMQTDPSGTRQKYTHRHQTQAEIDAGLAI